MCTIVSRLDVTQIFCDVDDFCSTWEQWWQQVPQLPSIIGERRSKSRMHLSEVMTIVIAFHGSGYRTFKEFYTLQVLPGWGKAFPNLVSYTRFVELMPYRIERLCCRQGEELADSLIDNVVALWYETRKGNQADFGTQAKHKSSIHRVLGVFEQKLTNSGYLNDASTTL